MVVVQVKGAFGPCRGLRRVFMSRSLFFFCLNNELLSVFMGLCRLLNEGLWATKGCLTRDFWARHVVVLGAEHSGFVDFRLAMSQHPYAFFFRSPAKSLAH